MIGVAGGGGWGRGAGVGTPLILLKDGASRYQSIKDYFRQR